MGSATAASRAFVKSAICSGVIVTYDVWTRHAFHRYDWKGNAITIAGNVASLNPFGVRPFLPLFDYVPDDQFFLAGGDDLIAAQTAVNVALANLWRTIEHQSHG